MSDDKKAPPDKLTRVPVRHVYFHDEMTFPDMGSGYSTLSNMKCYRETESQTRFAFCDWVPAWQQFEFTFYTGPRDEPKVRYVGVSRIKSWAREDGPREAPAR